MLVWVGDGVYTLKAQGSNLGQVRASPVPSLPICVLGPHILTSLVFKCWRLFGRLNPILPPLPLLQPDPQSQTCVYIWTWQLPFLGGLGGFMPPPCRHQQLYGRLTFQGHWVGVLKAVLSEYSWQAGGPLGCRGLT